jgi:hypothetical protein
VTYAMTLKVDWPTRQAPAAELCPGGCGMIHRSCCDSVLGAEHQTRCRLANPMLEAGARRPWWGRAAIARLRSRG